MEAERKRTDCRRPDDQEKCANCTTCREPCQVYDGDKPCGETQTLQIVKEFKELYEKKMHEIESTGGGDCVQVNIYLFTCFLFVAVIRGRCFRRLCAPRTLPVTAGNTNLYFFFRLFLFSLFRLRLVCKRIGLEISPNRMKCL